MFKITKIIITILVILFVLFIFVSMLYMATIVDSIGLIIFFIGLALFCCRVVYVLIKDVAFTRREYIEVVKKFPVNVTSKRPYRKKYLYSAKCVRNGKERIMYFKSNHDYFKVTEHKEYVMNSVGNKILEVE